MDRCQSRLDKARKRQLVASTRPNPSVHTDAARKSRAAPVTSTLGLNGEHLLIVDVTCKTDRFNLSVVGVDFINDCCFGEDFSNWLVEALTNVGVEADVICMEDFGWANYAKYKGVTYLMCVGGNSDEEPNHPNYGEWHVMLERQRTFMQKLLGKNKISASDPIVAKVVEVLRAAEFASVTVEP